MLNYKKSVITGKVNCPLQKIFVFLLLFSPLFLLSTKALAVGCVPSSDNVTGCIYSGTSTKMCTGNYNEYLQPLLACEGGNGYYRSTKYICQCNYRTQMYQCSPWDFRHVTGSYLNASLFSNQSCTKGPGTVSKDVATKLNNCDAWCKGSNIPTPIPTRTCNYRYGSRTDGACNLKVIPMVQQLTTGNSRYGK